MRKLFLLSGDLKSEVLEVLTSYITPTLSGKLQVISITPKQQPLIKLDTLPLLLGEEELITDFEKIVRTVCQLGTVDTLILKDPEIWSSTISLTFSQELQGKNLLDKLNTILANKTYLAAVHITLVDIFAILPAIRTLLTFPQDKQIEWINVYRWAEFLLNLPRLGNVLLGKGVDLPPLAMVIEKVKGPAIPEKKVESKEEEKGKPKDKKKAKADAKERAKERNKDKVPPKKADEPDPFSSLDFRVGKIKTIIKHPESTKLFLEEIDIGNGEIRKIATGLQEQYKEEDLLGRDVIVFCNLKEKNLGGRPSHGMILCASNPEKTYFEPLTPPAGSQPGDAVIIDGIPRVPVPDINISKGKNPWVKAEPKLTTSKELCVVYDGKPLKTAKGEIKVKSLVAGKIS